MRRGWRAHRTRSRWSLPLIAALLCTPIGVAADSEEVKIDTDLGSSSQRHLLDFFDRIEDYAPSAGVLPGARAGLLDSLGKDFDELDPETKRRMDSAGTRWKYLIEATAATLPPPHVESYRNLSRQALAEVEADAEDVRQARVALALLSLLGEEELAQMGIRKETVLALGQALATTDLPHAGALVQRLDGDGALRRQAAQTLAALPPDARAAVARLAERGKLSDEERENVAHFRARYTEMLRLAASMPPATAERFGFELSRETLVLAENLSDEALWLLTNSREVLGLEDMISGLRIIAHGEAPDPNAATELEDFRREALSWAEHPMVRAVAPSESENVFDLLDRAGAGELHLLKARFEQMPGWRILPHLSEVVNSPDYAAEVAALEGGTLAAERRDEIERFRQRWLEASAAFSDDAGDILRDDIRNAPLADLIAWERTSARIGESGERMLMQSLRAEIQVPARGDTVVLGDCKLSIPCYLNHLKDSVINGVKGVFNGIFSAVSTAVSNANTWATRVVTSVREELAALPAAALGLIENAYAAILTEIESTGVFDPSRIAEAMGVVDGFWENLPEAPEIPCPEIGSSIPGYGVVGDSRTAARYQQSSWVVEKVLALVPDDELALGVKIPLKSFWGGVQYLGQCLDNAAAAVAERETAAYRESIQTAVTDTNEDLANLDTKISVIHGELIDVSNRFARLTFANRKLALRFAIEGHLLERKGDRIGRFQLPEIYDGLLESVQEIVEETIDRVIEAGLNTYGAESAATRAFEQYQAGRYAEAFESYRVAYRRAVFQREVGNGNVIKP